MTPGRLWWFIRRDLKRGMAATWGDYVTRPKIWNWHNPYQDQTPLSTPVHFLCGAEQLDMAAWMLASWFHATRQNWRIVIHDDGSLPNDTYDRFGALGIKATVISRKDSDKQMALRLARHPACKNYRDRHPLALKIFDIPALSESDRIILLDTDLIFFKPPEEILNWVTSPEASGSWFNADAEEASNISAQFAQDQWGISLWPKVNSGLCLLERDTIDFDFCNQVLEQGDIFKGHIWRIEQTLFALCASRKTQGGLLPATYEVSLGDRAAPDCIMRHYVGAVRNRFWAEGINRTAHNLRSSP